MPKYGDTLPKQQASNEQLTSGLDASKSAKEEVLKLQEREAVQEALQEKGYNKINSDTGAELLRRQRADIVESLVLQAKNAGVAEQFTTEDLTARLTSGLKRENAVVNSEGSWYYNPGKVQEVYDAFTDRFSEEIKSEANTSFVVEASPQTISEQEDFGLAESLRGITDNDGGIANTAKDLVKPKAEQDFGLADAVKEATQDLPAEFRVARTNDLPSQKQESEATKEATVEMTGAVLETYNEYKADLVGFLEAMADFQNVGEQYNKEVLNRMFDTSIRNADILSEENNKQYINLNQLPSVLDAFQKSTMEAFDRAEKRPFLDETESEDFGLAEALPKYMDDSYQFRDEEKVAQPISSVDRPIFRENYVDFESVEDRILSELAETGEMVEDYAEVASVQNQYSSQFIARRLEAAMNKSAAMAKENGKTIVDQTALITDIKEAGANLIRDIKALERQKNETPQEDFGLAADLAKEKELREFLDIQPVSEEDLEKAKKSYENDSELQHSLEDLKMVGQEILLKEKGYLNIDSFDAETVMKAIDNKTAELQNLSFEYSLTGDEEFGLEAIKESIDFIVDFNTVVEGDNVYMNRDRLVDAISLAVTNYFSEDQFAAKASEKATESSNKSKEFEEKTRGLERENTLDSIQPYEEQLKKITGKETIPLINEIVNSDSGPYNPTLSMKYLNFALINNLYSADELRSGKVDLKRLYNISNEFLNESGEPIRGTEIEYGEEIKTFKSKEEFQAAQTDKMEGSGESNGDYFDADAFDL